MAEFSPSELDQIEDLLEDLEAGAGVAHPQLSLAARERLDEYRDILALSREAMPLEEPDPNLLAGVIAEARQGAFNATTTATGVLVGARERSDQDADLVRPSWFRRWIPAMALAASAAAVLFILRPGGHDESAGEAPTGLAQNDSPASSPETVPTPGSVDADKVARASAEEPGAEGLEEEAIEVDSEPDEDAAAPAPSVEPAPKAPQKTASKSRPGANAKPQLAEEPAQEEPTLDKDQAWGDLVRAHALRRRGECRGARSLYRGLEHEGLKDNVRAQALAGRGLCDEFDGEESAAEASYSKARSIRLDIDGWIEAERQEMRANGHMRKKKAQPAPSKKSKAKASKPPGL